MAITHRRKYYLFGFLVKNFFLCRKIMLLLFQAMTKITYLGLVEFFVLQKYETNCSNWQTYSGTYNNHDNGNRKNLTNSQKKQLSANKGVYNHMCNMHVAKFINIKISLYQ